jgi:hypothetical protein
LFESGDGNNVAYAFVIEGKVGDQVSLRFNFVNSNRRTINANWEKYKLGAWTPAQEFYAAFYCEDGEVRIKTKSDVVDYDCFDWGAVEAEYSDVWSDIEYFKVTKGILTKEYMPSAMIAAFSDVNFWSANFTDNIYFVPVLREPVVVNLGFIGWYIHESRPEAPMQTSFYWQTLNEGDTIDWDAVDAAYAEWVAGGGLAPDWETGIRTSGPASFLFNRRSA